MWLWDPEETLPGAALLWEGCCRVDCCRLSTLGVRGGSGCLAASGQKGGLGCGCGRPELYWKIPPWAPQRIPEGKPQLAFHLNSSPEVLCPCTRVRRGAGTLVYLRPPLQSGPGFPALGVLPCIYLVHTLPPPVREFYNLVLISGIVSRGDLLLPSPSHPS